MIQLPGTYRFLNCNLSEKLLLPAQRKLAGKRSIENLLDLTLVHLTVMVTKRIFERKSKVDP